ncbi:hypothetical protein A1O3_10330 [Capronia epimyces CBS 606.96]|uniref:Methyltransferase domain-containing protein n=1 Tax=Capronia epimyces CBS 606.96 TaxID=1182542 RepID=W9X9M9_9EURO|nr:uncharacterized protein A1O3_10330 [Capronia epimyces CBS 606.96]EXJ77172.1 hypothetical protein A1O3_10330 [Capronia epimyces CBS 606.96]
MATTPKQDKSGWESRDIAKAYSSAEAVTGPYAQDLLDRTILPDVDSDKRLVVLDLACGTGVISAKLMDMISQNKSNNSGDGENVKDTPPMTRPTLSLTCTDFSDAMIDAVTLRIKNCGWPNTKAIKSDAMDTKLPSAEYTHVLMNFGPFVLPDWLAGLREMHRMLQPGGILGFSSWKKVGWYADVRAALETDPELPAITLNEGMRGLMTPDGHWDDEEWVKLTVQKAGFEDVTVEANPYTGTMGNVDEFLVLMGGVLGFVTKAWTKEQQDRYFDRAKAVVEKYLRHKYNDGGIRWNWVAILTTAKKPT